MATSQGKYAFKWNLNLFRRLPEPKNPEEGPGRRALETTAHQVRQN
jgi:hypothetical protein